MWDDVCRVRVILKTTKKTSLFSFYCVIVLTHRTKRSPTFLWYLLLIYGANGTLHDDIYFINKSLLFRPLLKINIFNELYLKNGDHNIIGS